MRVIRTYTDGNFVLHHDNLDDSCYIYRMTNTSSLVKSTDSIFRLKVRQMAIKLLPKLGVI